MGTRWGCVPACVALAGGGEWSSAASGADRRGAGRVAWKEKEKKAAGVLFRDENRAAENAGRKHAKNISVGVGGDSSVGVGGDSFVGVGGDSFVGVGGDSSVCVGGDSSVGVGGDSFVCVGGDSFVGVGGDSFVGDAEETQRRRRGDAEITSTTRSLPPIHLEDISPSPPLLPPLCVRLYSP
uniref:Uncharacterized protein n=1 Tax=Knipowitschia caucasica TaxID=637954 RepID=A0AAV2LAM0_KNICA